MAPRLSDGWPHSAASHVSLKSSQRIMAPMLNAAITGSSSQDVPGTRAATGDVEPGPRVAGGLSYGGPHSAASHVSLKSSQRIMAPMLNAAITGSSSQDVPGTRAPPGNVAPGTTGPSSFVHSGKSSDWKAHASESIRQYR